MEETLAVVFLLLFLLIILDCKPVPGRLSS